MTRRFCANCDAPVPWRGWRWCRDCLRMAGKLLLAEIVALAVGGAVAWAWRVWGG